VTAFARPADSGPTAPPPPAALGEDAVWTPPENFLARFHAACDALGGTRLSECFVAQMQKAGAPPAAVAFSRRVGGQGYLRAFREAGRVDLALAEYPFRANENAVCLLVNGTPPAIDVDDLSGLDRQALEANPEYAALARSYPRITIFPGSRGAARGPAALRLSSGGQRFVVSYSLRDGCHACKIVGEAQLRFDFDVEGRFRGVEIQRVRPRYS
jgi:hypothetical protein